MPNLSLNRFALINMDEFDQNRVSQQAFLKHILQNRLSTSDVRMAPLLKRCADTHLSLGQSNHKDLLTDTSGSRRYIVINVTGPIDCSPLIMSSFMHKPCTTYIEESDIGSTRKMKMS